uniref:Uncharacterized protein n=1 Tax=Arundo donax TaxID=35708 RepID=A0A0A9FQU6_ARUDO
MLQASQQLRLDRPRFTYYLIVDQNKFTLNQETRAHFV